MLPAMGKIHLLYEKPPSTQNTRAVTIVTIIVTIVIVIYYRDNDSPMTLSLIAQLPLKNHKLLLEKQTALQ